jgi:hypothetical protein
MYMPLMQIVEHYEQVRQCESYRALPRGLVDEVAAHACDQMSQLLSTLRGLSGQARVVAGKGGAGASAALHGRGQRVAEEDDTDDDDDVV